MPPDRPRHVLLVVNDLQPYGSQRVAVQLTAALVGLGVRVDLLTLDPPDRDALPLPEGVRRLGIARPAGGARGYAAIVGGTVRVLSRTRPELVISHMVLANVTTLAAARLLPRSRRPPVVVTEHNRPSMNLAIERSAKALTLLGRRLYPSARRLVGVSDAVVEDATATYRLPPGLGVRVFNPVDADAVRAAGAAPAPHAWLADAGRPRTVVCVGGFRKAKGQDVLVAALAAAPEVRAVFVGDGAGAAEAEALAARLGVRERCAFAGYRDDAPAFIAHAGALVVPSRWEGFGLVAVEAAVLGVPVVGTAVSGLSELVGTRVPGVLVAPEEPAALAAAMQDVLGGRVALGQADLSLFAPREVALRYLDAAR